MSIRKVGCLHSAALRVVRTAAEKDRSIKSSSSNRGGTSTSSQDVAASASSGHGSGRGGIFALEPIVVAESSLRSLNYQSGIVLLEEMLLVRRGELKMGLATNQSTTKSSKTSGSATGTAITATGDYDEANSESWLQLSRLYAALGEKDVLVGISLRAAQNEVDIYDNGLLVHYASIK